MLKLQSCSIMKLIYQQNIYKLPVFFLNFNFCTSARTYNSSEEHFDKILIANRGEIACRVIRTAKQMGINTVSVYSTADEKSLHTRLADEAVWIGEAASQNSYLCADRIIEAAHRTGAQAIHPGYGFLSENYSFAKQLEDEKITFIGPSSQVLAVMGDKLASKEMAKRAGVNVIPGCKDIIASADMCVQAAGTLGYPVMIKALSGGGGKGMRVAHSDQEAREVFNLSKKEAFSSFNDDKMLVEKFIEIPRHIEFQVLGDNHGNVIHLFERECSIQRRNQKVIEEAPSMCLSKDMRIEMGKQAVALCQALKYSSAGTVEFLVDQNLEEFYFLEMNPRLQVEHAVTEAITGVDLVHQALRIAKGHRLELKQSDISNKGWAIECRVYAENPFINFGLPSIGRIHTYIEPTHLDNVRCDSGVEEGSDISIHYDPLISKLICHGATRKEAINLSIQALDSYVIRGVNNNIALLRDIMTEPRFVNGELSTNYLQQVYPEGFKGKQLTTLAKDQLFAAACCLYACEDVRARSFIATDKCQPRTLKPSPATWKLSVSLLGSQPQLAEVCHKPGVFEVILANQRKLTVNDDLNLSSSLLPMLINGNICNIQSVSRTSGRLYKLIYQGTTFSMTVMDKLASEYYQYMLPKTKTDFSKTVASPMPGLVKSVSCQVGDYVVEGQELCIIEAMKMQNSLCARLSGKVKDVKVKVGNTVCKNDLLILLD